MKKILLTAFLISLVALVIISRAGDSLPQQTAVFVSKESSRGMVDQNAFQFHEKLREKFKVIILKDSDVAANSADWQDALDQSVLVFVMAQSDETLSVNRIKFCSNLSVVLDKLKGVFFGGNSLIYSETLRGCPYTPYFDFATASNNTEMAKKTINISRQHQITNGYETRSYNISVVDTIYTVNNLKDGQTLATVYGDPDGTGPATTGDYPVIAIKEGVKYRSVLWGINTSEIDCPGCLGWAVFNQALDWVSNTSDMGYKLTTDRTIYQQGDRIYINVTANAPMFNVSGNITRPDGVTHSLSFSGSGNLRTSYYPTYEEDPNGIYTIKMNVDGIRQQKAVTLKAFNLTLGIMSEEEKVYIQANVKDQRGNYIKDVNITINITSPSGQKFGYSTIEGEIIDQQNGTFVLVFNVSPGIFGKHSVYAFAKDSSGRFDTATDTFLIPSPFKMELYPEMFEKVVFGPITFNESIRITNSGPANLTNMTVSKTGDVKDWISLQNITLPVIAPASVAYFYFNISVPEVTEGNHTASIIFSTNQGEKAFPVSIQMKFIGRLLTEQSIWKAHIPVDKIFLKEITLSNPARGNISIISVDVVGGLTDYVAVQKRPATVMGGASEELVLKIDTSGVEVENTRKMLLGAVEIKTDFPDEDKRIDLEITAVRNFVNEADSLLSRIPGLQSRISALEKDVDASSVKSDLSDVNDNLESVKKLYQEEKYEEAATKFDDVKKDLSGVELNISDLEERVEAEKVAQRTKIFVAYVLMVVVIVGAVVFLFLVLKLKPWSEYQKLRDKWKNKT